MLKKIYKGENKKKIQNSYKKPIFKNKLEKQEDFSKKNTIKGIYKQSINGDFGFIDIEGIKKGYYVYSFNRLDALDGDEVLAEIKTFKGKDEAVVLKVLKRTEKNLVGEYMLSKNLNYGFVILNSSSFKKDIFIHGKYSLDAKNGDIVGVKISKWEGKNPEGKIIKILGKKGDKKIDIEGFILEAGFKTEFQNSVEGYANKIRSIDFSKNRIDLRKLFTFTIDGEDAKDLDDAISIEKLDDGNYKLYVHIADVCNYVTEKSIIDVEAFERGTSVYLTDRVLPMLPKKLSNDLCSLNPDTDKLTLTCEMVISADGNLLSQKVYESKIKSDFRLTYKFVQDLIDTGFNGIIEDIFLYNQLQFFNNKKIEKSDEVKLIESIKISKCLKEIISESKGEKGVLNFDFPETKIILGDDYEISEIKRYPIYESNKIIEEFMIMANEAVSREFSNYPFLYRIHDLPTEDDIVKLQKIINLFGLKYIIKSGNTKDFSNLLNKINEIDELGKKLFLEKTILRTLSKAVYTSKNVGHFGLGIDYYSHFTSPIRRYPDLQIHRIIKEKLAGKLNKARIEYYKNMLEDVAIHSSEQERKAEKLEYKVRDYFIVKYYKKRVGEIFDGVITTMMPRGFFVQLEDTAEGFVELDNNYLFNDDLQEFKNKKTSFTFKIGDNLKVKLVEADEKLIRLNFEIV